MNKCQICKQSFKDSETYEYRWFTFCELHFDEWISKVDYKRNEVIEVAEKTIKSQINWQWHNWGYKTMKTDIWWNPIGKIKSSKILEDYEQWIL